MQSDSLETPHSSQIRSSQRKLAVQDFFIGEGEPLAVISGPCVIESEEHCLKAAEALQKIFIEQKIPYVFKTSYDKANRSSLQSYRGPGLEEGLRILEKVKKEYGLPILTDVHTPEEAVSAAEVVDIIQIPAFLCRQTDLLVAAAKTGKVVSIKKGQFLAPWDMAQAIAKVIGSGNTQVMAIDRGTTFGYNNLVSDFRSIPVMQKLGVPVCYDATHSVQLPGGLGDRTGGQREFIPILARAAVAAGVDCLYMEAHPDPDRALSDATTVLDFKALPKLLDTLKRLYAAVHYGE